MSSPFTVDAVPDIGRALSGDAVLNQKPLLPRRFFLLMSLLLLVLLMLVLLITTLLQKDPVSMAGPSPITPSVTTTAAPPPTPSPGPTTTSTVAPPPVAAPPPDNGAGGGNPAPLPGGGTPTFTIDAVAYPGSPGVTQTFSYSVPAGRTLRLVSVTFDDQHTDSGSLQVRTDTTPVADFALADLRHLGYRFPNPPSVAGGQLVTLAITCANTTDPCTPTATFTAITGR